MIDRTIQSRAESAANLSLYHVFLYQGKNALDKKDHPTALNFFFRSLECGCKCNLHEKNLGEILSEIKEVATSKQVTINPVDFELYFSIISQTKHPDSKVIEGCIKSLIDKNAP
ncbi:MAG: hypothetical protein NC131_19795, partial [Roseburia sp.]|nr:hypothetical protein [Roseburia sp.]